jgi:hypothetical protein
MFSDVPSDEDFVQALSASKQKAAVVESKPAAALSVEEELAKMLANPMLSLGDDDGTAVDDSFDFNSYIKAEAKSSSSNKLFDD